MGHQGMRRQHRHQSHENHERWLVSYADFITLLFAFFVVMYSISQVNEGKYRVLSNALVSAFKNGESPIVAAGTPIRSLKPQVKSRAAQSSAQPDPAMAAQTKKMRGMARDLQSVLQPLVKEGMVRVTQSKRGVAVEISARALFPPANADLAPESQAALRRVAEVLAQTDNLIQVEGHTDNVPIASPQFPSNWELSAARAGSVVRLFAESGVLPHRLVALGYADNRPIDGNDTPEGRARNRRVTIMILADNRDEVTVLPLEGDRTP